MGSCLSEDRISFLESEGGKEVLEGEIISRVTHSEMSGKIKQEMTAGMTFAKAILVKWHR